MKSPQTSLLCGSLAFWPGEGSGRPWDPGAGLSTGRKARFTRGHMVVWHGPGCGDSGPALAGPGVLERRLENWDSRKEGAGSSGWLQGAE